MDKACCVCPLPWVGVHPCVAQFGRIRCDLHRLTWAQLVFDVASDDALLRPPICCRSVFSPRRQNVSVTRCVEFIPTNSGFKSCMNKAMKTFVTCASRSIAATSLSASAGLSVGFHLVALLFFTICAGNRLLSVCARLLIQELVCTDDGMPSTRLIKVAAGRSERNGGKRGEGGEEMEG